LPVNGTFRYFHRAIFGLWQKANLSRRDQVDLAGLVFSQENSVSRSSQIKIAFSRERLRPRLVPGIPAPSDHQERDFGPRPARDISRGNEEA
jgi:hypothetical protein